MNTWQWQRVENPWQEPENTTVVFALNAWRGYLYPGTRNLHNGGEVLRSADGIYWHSIAAQGFGDAANRDIYGFVGFKDMLYAGTYNAVRGEHHTESDRGAEIWRSASGTDWEPVVQDGFGGKDLLGVLQTHSIAHRGLGIRRPGRADPGGRFAGRRVCERGSANRR